MNGYQKIVIGAVIVLVILGLVWLFTPAERFPNDPYTIPYMGQVVAMPIGCTAAPSPLMVQRSFVLSN